MFFRHINDETQLSLSIPAYAEQLFALTDRNRDFLKQWLPWLDGVTRPEHSREFINSQLLAFQQGRALHCSILYRGQLAGVLAYNSIDRANGTGHVGYWLGREYNGKGLMTECLRDLVTVGFRYYALNRIEVRCAAGNHKSRAIPERLGFRREAVLRQQEWLYDKYVDHVVYGLLKSESSAAAQI